MDVAVADARPVHELDAELERRLGLGHQVGLVDTDAAIEETDVWQRGFAHADDADLAGFDQADLPLLRPEHRGKGRGCHPARRTAANDDDLEWLSHS